MKPHRSPGRFFFKVKHLNICLIASRPARSSFQNKIMWSRRLSTTAMLLGKLQLSGTTSFLAMLIWRQSGSPMSIQHIWSSLQGH